MSKRGTRWLLTLSLVACCALVAPGCGGGGDAEQADNGDGGDSPQPTDETPGTKTAAARQDGRWFDDIPNDIWYSNPIATANDMTAVGAGGATGTPVAGDTTPMGGDPEPMPMDEGGELDWAAIIPPDVVDSEVTDIRNRLKQSLVSVAQYNTSYLSLMPHIQTMGVMAEIAGDHPGDIRWKENALVIRDLARQMAAEKLMRGPASKKKIEEPYFQIEDTLAGSPPDLEPEGDILFSDIAEMSELMKRLDTADKRLTVEIGSEEALAEKAELAKHEAAVLAALAKVIMMEGFGYAGDEDFEGHALPMMEAGIKIVEAADKGDFATFDAAKTRIKQSCSDCHRSYR